MSVNWFHPICDDCYTERVPGRRPFRVQEFITDTCCFCDSPSVSGIYVREDPTDLLCKGVHEDSIGREAITAREGRRGDRRVFLQVALKFHLCPNSGRVIAGGRNDNKTICGCGLSNLRIPGNHKDAVDPSGMVHHTRKWLETATVEEWIEQEEREGR